MTNIIQSDDELALEKEKQKWVDGCRKNEKYFDEISWLENIIKLRETMNIVSDQVVGNDFEYKDWKNLINIILDDYNALKESSVRLDKLSIAYKYFTKVTDDFIECFHSLCESYYLYDIE
jgi:hypothetical protein